MSSLGKTETHLKEGGLILGMAEVKVSPSILDLEIQFPIELVNAT